MKKLLWVNCIMLVALMWCPMAWGQSVVIDGIPIGTNNPKNGKFIDLTVTDEFTLGGETVTTFSGINDNKAKVSSDDTTPGFLNGKLVGGSGVTLTEGSGGGNETLTISADDNLTTKGDVLTHNGTADVRIGVGNDGQVLVADSNESAGIKWASPQSGGASNLIINGNLEVNQENNTNPSDDEYTVGDLFNYVGEASATVTRVAGGPSGSNYHMNVRIDTANSQAGIAYFLSNADIQNIVQDGFASFSFAAKTTSGKAIDNLRAVLLSWTGTADTLTSDVIGTWAQDGTNPTFATSYTAEFTAVDLALTTSWQVFSTEAIAVDTSGVNNLALVIWTDDGTIAADDEFQLAQFNLNRGSNVQAFSTPLVSETQPKVEYYFQKVGSMVLGRSAGTAVEFFTPLAVTMRVTPSISLIDSTVGYRNSADGSDHNNTSASIGNQVKNRTGIYYQITGFTSTGTSNSIGLSFSDDIFCDARL